MPPPRRTDSGHRLYNDRSAHHVMFIRRAQELGLTLDDIRKLLALRDYHTPVSMRRVTEILTARSHALERRMAQYQGYRSRLASVLARFTGSGAESLPAILGIPDNRRSRRKGE